MKKVILYLVLGLLSLSSFGLNSVAAKGQQQVSNPAIPYNGNLLVECISGYEAYSYNLWAGQTNDAGSVVITTDGTSLVVTVNALGELDDVHVYLYTEDQVLPSSRPIPGHAPYVANNIDCHNFSDGKVFQHANGAYIPIIQKRPYRFISIFLSALFSIKKTRKII